MNATFVIVIQPRRGLSRGLDARSEAYVAIRNASGIVKQLIFATADFANCIRTLLMEPSRSSVRAPQASCSGEVECSNKLVRFNNPAARAIID